METKFTNRKYELKSVSDTEWLAEVPDEMLKVYLSLDQYGGKEIISIPQGFTEQELDVFVKKYPKWFININK